MNLHYHADNKKELFKLKTDNKNVNFPTQFCLGSMSNGFSNIESKEVTLNGRFLWQLQFY